MFFLLVASAVHVPQYGDSCDQNCCHPPHDPKTSQVAHLTNSGGIEYGVDELHDPVLEFNVVFKKRYDPTTFSIFVGCGGCATAEPVSPPLDLPEAYAAVKFEPFTQHAYYELLPEGDARRFNTSALRNCSSHHASVRLIVHDNATEDVVYGVVVGCAGLECERFTAIELLSWPIFVLRSHGPEWNDARWTIVLLALTVPMVAAAVVWIWFGGLLIYYVPVYYVPVQSDSEDYGPVDATFSLRCVFYGLACYAIGVDLLETFAHFLVGAQDAPVNGDDGYTIFMVWYAAKLALFLAVALPWAWAREVPDEMWRKGPWYKPVARRAGSAIGPCSQFWARGYWSIADMAIAVGALFVGAGFYIYPVAAFIAGALRFAEWRRGRRIPEVPRTGVVSKVLRWPLRSASRPRAETAPPPPPLPVAAEIPLIPLAKGVTLG
jgi:hypothetical protein